MFRQGQGGDDTLAAEHDRQAQRPAGRRLSKQYHSDRLSALKDAVDLFKRYGDGGDNADLKTWAVKSMIEAMEDFHKRQASLAQAMPPGIEAVEVQHDDAGAAEWRISCMSRFRRTDVADAFEIADFELPSRATTYENVFLADYEEDITNRLLFQFVLVNIERHILPHLTLWVKSRVRRSVF